jgi:hypothetical protein
MDDPEWVVRPICLVSLDWPGRKPIQHLRRGDKALATSTRERASDVEIRIRRISVGSDDGNRRLPNRESYLATRVAASNSAEEGNSESGSSRY